MRPYEAERRVYVIAVAHLLNDDAADALLKDLEEPPPYAVIVLVADELGPDHHDPLPLPAHAPFRRLPGASSAGCWPSARRGSPRTRRAPLRRGGPARSGRAAARPGVEGAPRCAPARCPRAVRQGRSRPGGRGGDPARQRPCRRRGGEDHAERELEGVELTSRELEQRLRRVQRGAEREELLASLEEIASWYRDLVVVAAGAERTVVHADRLELLRAEGDAQRSPEAEQAAELAREVARARGVQPEPESGSGSALRPLATGIQQRFAGLN